MTTNTETTASVGIKASPQLFSLKSPLLSQGRLDNHVAQTDLMKVTVKVYASGGENAMHMHPFEDHTFIVLQGQATFHLETDDNVKVLNRNDGVMIPMGVCYWFLSSSEENLVMLRVGAATKWPENKRAFPDGRPFVGDTKKNQLANKQVERIEIPGQFFAL